MPVKGIPDPKQHRFCMSCRRWFEPVEGETLERIPLLARLLPASIRSGFDEFEQDEKGLFICAHCARIRKTWQTALAGVIFLSVLVSAAYLLLR